ncbi:MAG TPA: glycosyltransferase family 4 protein [Pyrinomonadaceae bacterium]|nr:glycosyltransferase family 4 protein [Pyrinomonadaceae bacterium]
MKLLLIQKTVYYPTFGGANKSNLILMETLAARGHQCRVVAPSAGAQAATAQGVRAKSNGHCASRYERNGVEVYAVGNQSQLREQVIKQARDFDPDWVLVSSEDPGQYLLAAALTAQPERVVYLAHTTLALPFGPAAALRSARAADLLAHAAGIVAVSDYLRDYIRHWGGLDCVSLPLALYGAGPYPDLSSFYTGSVTMINPCAVKGISIFVELARRMPHMDFMAVASWGTTESDLAQLQSLPNIRIVQPVDDIAEILAETRVLVVPSLWAEALGRVITEAMLHGIPVLAADVGGTREALLGMDYLLPVCEIQEYERRVDARMMPVPVIPPQDVEPWIETLRRVTEDRAEYERVSRAGRAAAHEYVSRESVDGLESYLLDLQNTRTRPAASAGQSS